MAESVEDLMSSSKRSHFYFVDLAGSERIKKTGATGQLLQEAKFIGASLSCLNLCMRSIQQGDKRVPYRNSQLTRVLKNCLRRSELYVMVLTISVNNLDVEETASTLSFGLSCMNMRVQHKASDYTGAELTERVIRELNEKSRSLTDAVGELSVLKQANADWVREKEELLKQHKAYEKQLRSLQRRLDEKSKEVEDLAQMHQ